MANLDSYRAARRKYASRRQVLESGNTTPYRAKLNLLFVLAQSRNTVQQSMGVWVERILKELHLGSMFDELARVENGQLVCKLGNNTQVVGDVQRGRLAFAHQLLDEV